ncbi:hypothetical protein [Mucilaginibacter sp.]|uniref:hypothetical protein n=1 Tax=Mucilaginibacter sp. TaxID=1882438 RepID=UPI0025FE9913|nr:hypothetical protein [Mucilaginibacter sp.]
MSKVYDILLDNIKIGTTVFENADPTMGVVFGRINFLNIGYDFNFFRAYCLLNGVDFQKYIEDKLITTSTIPGLRVYNRSGDEVKGDACSISGMDGDFFDVTISGIPYPFYEEEFPQHPKAKE